MIIISQDKDNVVKFDRIKSLWIDDNVLDRTNTTFEILADDESLGEYATEERAKEVLQEIIKTYTCWENFKYGIAEGIGTPKYEMPGE